MNFLYFDPGLGAMIIQAIVAAVAGVLLFSKNVLYKIRVLLGITSKKDDMYDDMNVEDSDLDPENKRDWKAAASIFISRPFRIYI